MGDYLRKPQIDELGRPSGWLGAYLARVYAVDLFLGNWDRHRANFILRLEGVGARLCAFDFGETDLRGLAGLQFPIASSATVQLGRFLRQRHGFILSGADEALDKLENVPSHLIASILESMPADWMDVKQRDDISELWSSHRIEARLHALRSGLTDGSLL